MTEDFWDDMRDEGFLVVDAPARKIAIYPNDSGMVVIAIQEDGVTCATVLQVCEVGSAISAIQDAQIVAAPKEALIESQYAAHCAIEKART